MKKGNKKIEKLCSFYVSNWHLVTMLLPYINHQIDENVKIITILENDIEEYIQTLVKKLNLKNKNEILNIKWTSVKSKKYSDIAKKLKDEMKVEKRNMIFINGCSNYIEKNNANIEKWIEKSQIQSVKVIALLEVPEFNNHIMEILDAHDKVLNTSGEKEIEEVFEGYVRGEKIETQKVVGSNFSE